MSWNSPLEIRETLVDNCSLLPFSEIENIFQKMMIMINEPTAKQSYTDSLQFSIDFIKLELIRVIERNSIENGLLIPVWQFYGTKDLKWTQGAPPIHEYSCLLTINAVDGSIIDLSKGY